MSYNLEQIEPEERTELYADPRDEGGPSRPRQMLRVGGALLVMGLFAGGLWLAYVAGTRHSSAAGDGANIPLIRADTRPVKVKPADPGGMQIPDRDLFIYGQRRPAVEHLLPPPEQPMPRPAPPPAPVRTAAAAPPPAMVSGRPPATPLGQPAVAAPAVPTETAVAGPRPRPAALSPANLPKPAPARTPAAKSGALRLQLGSVRSEDVARAEWEHIRRQNADLLGHLSGVAIRADLGDKGVYYRIQAGPVSDSSAADRICGELRQRHLACIIVR